MAGRKIVSVRLSEARALYLTDMRETGKAQNTIESAKSVLDALERILGNKIVRNIDKPDIGRYFSARVGEGMRQSSLNLHTTRLKLFFRWCEEEAFIDPAVRPMRGRGQVKLIPRPRARLVQEDFPALLDSAPNPRDRIVLAVGIYTMVRSSELRTMRIGDVDLAGGTIDVIRWKTRTPDTLPISTELHDELANYFAWYSTFLGVPLQPEWYVAPGNKRRVARMDPVTKRFVQLPVHEMILTPEKAMWEQGYAVIVQRALRSLGWDVQPGEGMHTLRRSGARELFDHLREQTGMDDSLMTVMSLLGHKKPETTLIYLGVQREGERRNKVLKNSVMFPRAAKRPAGLRLLEAAK